MLLYHHPNLTGLEVWHGLARHATLYQLREDKPTYFAALNEFLDLLHAGAARTPDDTDLTPAAGFERLILTGGDAAGASPYVERPHRVENPGPFAARPGAEALWREYGWRNPVAIDLGQSRIKVLTASTSIAIERTNRPFHEILRPLIPGNCGGAILALPTKIRPDGTAEPCSYPGLYGPVEPLFADLFPCQPWLAVNDAILAARGHQPTNNEKTLVLTLGFGVGAALWQKPCQSTI